MTHKSNLTASERSELEGLLNAGRTSLNAPFQMMSTLAVEGVWDIYTDNGQLPSRRTAYLAEINQLVAPSGVFVDSAGYALARFNDTQGKQKVLHAHRQRRRSRRLRVTHCDAAKGTACFVSCAVNW
jgi:hypothetical protein